MISFKQAQTVLLTLGIAAAGGSAFLVLRLPASWLLGSLLAVAIAALARIPLLIPERLRDGIFLLVGVSLGSGLNREGMAALSKYPATLTALMLSVAVSIAASGAFLRRHAKWDRATAFFASVPGALTSVLATATHTPANSRLVALTQMFRMLLLMALLPLLTVGAAPAQALDAPATLDMAEGTGLVLEILGGVLLGCAAHRLRLPGAMLIGGMLSAGLFHWSGSVVGQVPSAVFIPSQVALGALMGTRFQGTDLPLLRRAIVPSLGAFVITLLVSSLAAWLTTWALHLPHRLVWVAFAPGALEVMTVFAFALGVDPAFVAGHHLARFIGLSVMLPLAGRYLSRTQPGLPLRSVDP